LEGDGFPQNVDNLKKEKEAKRKKFLLQQQWATHALLTI